MKNLLKVSIIIFSVELFTSCNKDTPPPPTYIDQGNIGTQGGTVKTNDGASVEIPAGALSESRAIYISNKTPGDTIPNTGYSVYELKPDGLKFNDSIIITLPFDGTYIDLNSDEENYGIYIAVIKDTTVTKLKTEIDLVNKIAKVKTTHFSNYYIFSPSSWSSYYENNKSGPSKIMPTPYYRQVGQWCFYASLSMIIKYAGYPYKAPTLASFFEEGDPETTGFYMYDYVFIKRLKISLGMLYEYSTFWTNYENMYGYILNRLNNGLPVLIMSTKLGHAIVVTGHDQTDFYVNNPNSIPIMDHYTYENFKDWIGISVLNYCNTLCITSKSNGSNTGLTLNFHDEFDLNIKDNQTLNMIGGLKINGKLSGGYTIIDNKTNLTGNFDGSDYLTVNPIIANSYSETKLANLHTKIDNKDIKGSPQQISLSRRTDYQKYDPIITQLSNLAQGRHVLSIELRSTDSQTLYDSWDFGLNIAKEFIDNGHAPTAPSSPYPSDGANNISTSPTLSWNSSNDPDGDPVTYDVYFGINSASLTLVSSGQTGATFTRTGLSSSVTYYWKVVAKDNHTNSTSGPIWSFTTAATPTIPTVTTTAISSITQTNANSGGNVTSSGSTNVTARGVCWGSSQNPTTANSHTSDETGTGSFTSNISGLTFNTTYYVRAYAINSVGTSYGNQVSFMTLDATLASVSTNSVNNIGQTTASCGGDLTSSGGSEVTDRGVCWSTSQNPTIANNHTPNGTGTGSFTSSLTGLAVGTTYYVRAYATNGKGTAYGNQVNFTTAITPTIPTVTTTAISGITQTSATSGGNVTSIGSSDVIVRGVCWSTSANPTTTDNVTTDGAGAGSYTSNITGLTAGTTYHVRAYTRNNVDIAYGVDRTFTTNALTQVPPTVTTTAVSNITQTIATTGGNVTSSGSTDVIVRGVCWSTSSNPTTTDNVTTDGAGTGSFTSNITGLTAGTTYHVRAYAINSAGTAYGNDRSFTTLIDNHGTVIDIDNNVYNTVNIGGQWWMAENLKSTKYNDGTIIPLVTNNTTWSNLTSGAYCWYNNNSAYENPYGKLYNWYTVNTGKLCPAGWHVPSYSDWIMLTNNQTGGNLKESGTIHWLSPNAGADNLSGFSGLPGGYSGNNADYFGIGTYGAWWSASEYSATNARYFGLTNNSAGYELIWQYKYLGMSVRCIQDGL
jgi:uncharacterized protein (TIGR02145 family)